MMCLVVQTVLVQQVMGSQCRFYVELPIGIAV